MSTRICMVMIFTLPSTTGFQRGDFTLAGVKTVSLCSAHAWKSLFRTGLIQSLFRATRYFTVVRSDSRGHAAKIGQRIIVHPDPVPDIAFGHAFGVKVITVGKGSDKNRDLCGLFRVPPIVQVKLLSCIVQFEVDTGVRWM